MKIELIVTDIDGTAVMYKNNGEFSSGWDTLAEILSEDEKKEWFALAKKYYKTPNYEEWFNTQVKLLKGKRLIDAERVLFPVPYSPGFQQFFQNSNGLKKAMLSAGIDLVAEKIADEFKFDYWIAQHLEIVDGIFTGKGTHFAAFDKSRFLKEICGRFNIPLEKTCYIGDTEGDISCLDIAGFPIAFNPHHGLDKHAEEKEIPVIYDFRQLNNLLGYN